MERANTLAHLQRQQQQVAGSPQRSTDRILPRPGNMPTHQEPGSKWHNIGVNSELEAHAPRRTRAGKPKVRTGCQTCKIRRVKCDEEKPLCLRCQSLKIPCQGYVAPVARRRKKAGKPIATSRPRPLVPIGVQVPTLEEQLHTSSPTSPPASPQILLPGSPSLSPAAWSAPAFPLSRSLSQWPRIASEDVIYFDYFRHQVVNNLAGFYTTPVWSRLISGENLQDDCIQHSMLAIGAFMRSLLQTSRHPALECSDALSRKRMLDRIINQHHQIALQHYVKAVTSFRQRIQYLALSAPSQVVMTTLLLVVFELLQGKVEAAKLLTSSAISLLDGLTTPNKQRSKGVRRHAPDYEFQEVECVLPTISVMTELSHLLRPQRQSRHISRMEDNFRFPDPDIDPISKVFSYWGRFFTLSIIFLRQSICCGLGEKPANAILQLIPRQETLLIHLNRWKAILESYSQSSIIDASAKSALRLARVHWLLLHITISCSLDPTQVDYDSYDSKFRELCILCVGIIQDGLSHQRPTSVLLGEGLILPLATVIRFCRDHDIRMMAVETVRRIPWSMVAWDVGELMSGLLGAVSLEEIGRDKNGVIPPESRWFWLEDEHGEDCDYSFKTYQRLVPDEQGFIIRKKMIRNPDIASEICTSAGCSKDHSFVE